MARISIFKCISGLCTNMFHNVEGRMCSGEAVKLQRVRAEKRAEVATVKRPGSCASAL